MIESLVDKLWDLLFRSIFLLSLFIYEYTCISRIQKQLNENALGPTINNLAYIEHLLTSTKLIVISVYIAPLLST